MASGTKFTRTEFYDLVWRQPMKDLSEVVGVSAPSLKNTCRKYDIPVPHRGYWAKIKAGKPTKRISLPNRAPGMSDEFVLGGNGYGRYYTLGGELDEPLPPPPTFSTPIEEVRVAVAKKVGRVSVPRGKHDWHHVIQRLFAADDKRRAKQAASRWALSWDNPLFDNPFEQRRLKILNALFLGVAKCGGKPTIQGKEAIEISIAIHQQDVPLKLLATSDTKRRGYYRNPGDHHPVKEPLSLIVPNYHHENDIRVAWADEPDAKLETRLTEIAVELIVLAEILHRENSERQHKWLIERKEEHERRKSEAEAARIEAIRVRNERFEAAKRDMLVGHARDLDYARTLRCLANDVLAQKGGLVEEETEAWAQFVREEADRLDPMTNNRFLDVMKLNPEDFAETED